MGKRGKKMEVSEGYTWCQMIWKDKIGNKFSSNVPYTLEEHMKSEIFLSGGQWIKTAPLC